MGRIAMPIDRSGAPALLRLLLPSTLQQDKGCALMNPDQNWVCLPPLSLVWCRDEAT